jgi:hypothetical protein
VQFTRQHTTMCACPCCFHTPQAIYDRVSELIEAAGQAGVNVLCLQEAW